MISVSNMFLINEGTFPETKKELSKYLKSFKIKNFIDLSKKLVKDGADSLSPPEKTKLRTYFDDEEVQSYILAARKAGERDGWLRGGSIGALTGGGIGSVAGLVMGGGVGGMLGLGLLGAVVGGGITGWTFSEINGLLSKWKAEDDIIKLGKVGGKFGKTVPIINVQQ